MSDIFFIISSVCVVVITILLSLLLVKSIETVDGVNEVVDKARTTTSTIANVVARVSSATAFLSPLSGVASTIFKKRRGKRSKAEE